MIVLVASLKLILMPVMMEEIWSSQSSQLKETLQHKDNLCAADIWGILGHDVLLV